MMIHAIKRFVFIYLKQLTHNLESIYTVIKVKVALTLKIFLSTKKLGLCLINTDNDCPETNSYMQFNSIQIFRYRYSIVIFSRILFTKRYFLQEGTEILSLNEHILLY